MLFIVTAPYTCEYVSEMFFFRFFAAKYRELTSSEALDAKGVRTKEAKNGDGSPAARLSDVTAPTIGSASRPTSTIPHASSTNDLRAI